MRYLRQIRLARRIVAVGAAGMLIVACGSDDDPSTTSAAAAPTEAPADDAAGSGTSSGDTAPADEGAAAPGEDEWQATIDAANAEGRVTVYSVMLPNQNEALEAGFESTYPEIDMEVIRVLGEMDSKLDAERETDAEGADVGMHVNYPWLIKAAESGDFIEMTGPAARGPDWEGTPWIVDGLYQYSAFQILGIGCNTDLTDDCPTSYEDALRDEFDGLIGVVDPGSVAVTDFAVFLTEQLEDEGMQRLRDLNPVFYSSAVPAQQGLAAGEVAVLLYSTAQLRDDAEAGAPVEFIVPSPAWSPPVVSYILEWAAHPNAAQLVLDYVATPEGQAAIAINGASALENVPGTLTDIDDVHPVDIVRATNEWAEPHQAEWQSFFGR